MRARFAWALSIAGVLLLLGSYATAQAPATP